MAILFQIIRIGFEVMQWLIIGRVMLSWVNVGANNRISAFIYEVTEPILRPLRSIMPRGAMSLDFSPILAIILLQFLERFLLRIMF